MGGNFGEEGSGHHTGIELLSLASENRVPTTPVGPFAGAAIVAIHMVPYMYGSVLLI